THSTCTLRRMIIRNRSRPSNDGSMKLVLSMCMSDPDRMDLSEEEGGRLRRRVSQADNSGGRHLLRNAATSAAINRASRDCAAADGGGSATGAGFRAATGAGSNTIGAA